MAKVYTGKVSIPGDKIDEFLKLLEQAEQERAPFREHLEALNEEFYQHLLRNFSERTADKHYSIVHLFIDFLCNYTDVQSLEEITRGMVNTHFKQWWKRKVWDATTPEQLKTALRKFFSFLAEKKGIVNEKAMKGLAR